jgi:hypothetical protein
VRRFPVCYKRWRRRATRVLGLLPNRRMKAQFWTPGFWIPGLHVALRNSDSDVFHVGPLPYDNLMYAGLQAGQFRHVPVIATPCAHLGESGNDEVAKHDLQAHQIALLRHCDLVLCMTETEREQLERRGVPAARLATIGLGCRLATGYRWQPRTYPEAAQDRRSRRASSWCPKL